MKSTLSCSPGDRTEWRIASDSSADLILPPPGEGATAVEAVISFDNGQYHLRSLSEGIVRVSQRGWREGFLDPQCYIWFGENRYLWDQGYLTEAPAKGYLGLRDLEVVRGTHTVLRHLDFQLKHDAFRGGMTGVFGPSGCGKSSLVSAILGEIKPSDGQVIRHPECVIGYVPQHDILPEYRTVGECLEEAVIYRNPQMTMPEVVAKARSLAAMVELGNQFDQPVKELSGGQKKRVSVATELAGDPDILMLDEPTTGLDPSSQKNVMDKLANVAKFRDITVICVTHALETMHYFDQVVILRALGDQTDQTESSLLFAAPFRRGTGTEGTIGKICHEFRINQLSEIFGLTDSVPPTNQIPFDDSEESLESAGEGGSRGINLSRLNWPAWWRQTKVNTLRSCSQLYRSPKSLIMTFALPIALGILIFLAEGRPAPLDIRDSSPGLFLYSGVAAIWLGMSLVIRTIVSEKKNYQRNLRSGMQPLSYVSGKVIFLVLGATAQSLVFTMTLVFSQLLAPWGLELRQPWPEVSLVISFFLLVLSTLVGGGLLGLAVSAAAPNEYFAVSFIPLLLIPHLLFNMSSYQASPIYRDENPYNPVFKAETMARNERAPDSIRTIDASIHNLFSLPLLSRPFLNLLECRVASIQREKLDDPLSDAIAHPSQDFIDKNQNAFRREIGYFFILLMTYLVVMVVSIWRFLPNRKTLIEHE